jgi:hypothetical protein
MNSDLLLLVDSWCSFSLPDFTTGFGQLDTIADQDRAVIDFRHEGGRQTHEDQATPKGGEGVNENRLAVKEIEHPVIENLLQA